MRGDEQAIPVSASAAGVSARLSFPQDERRQPWLAPLLEAYHLIDQGVAEGIDRAVLHGRQLACAKGCATCCRAHTTIPVYPLELIGIYWFVSEHLVEPGRGRLREQLRSHVSGGPCPFLVDESCSIHPLRPMACRQFNVFDHVCAEGEDAFHTRPQDVLVPDRRAMDAAFFEMLPFYGVKGKRERREVLKKGLQHSLAKVLQQHDWAKLAERMGERTTLSFDIDKAS